MQIEKTSLEGVILIKPQKHEDSRGYFSETFSKIKIEQFKNLDFVQDNQSLSVQQYVFRGLHYQIPPYAQDKLVRVLQGKIFDVVVDMRKSSKTFGNHAIFEISSKKFNQLFVPKGFAHGFLTLEPNTEAYYKVTNYYAPKHDYGLNIFDPQLNIKLPIAKELIQLSEKDKIQPNFNKVQYFFD
jgi:dTDP-4-dehydrorhamnose 3,5-epimerase